jgi:hypothetical protein
MTEQLRRETDLAARRAPRPWLATAAAITSISAFGGTIGLLGGALTFPDEILQRIPAESHALAGLALLVWVAVPFAALAVAAGRGSGRTPDLAVGCGLLLVAWIVVQILIIRSFSWFQPTYLVIGLLFIRAGRRDR